MVLNRVVDIVEIHICDIHNTAIRDAGTGGKVSPAKEMTEGGLYITFETRPMSG